MVMMNRARSLGRFPRVDQSGQCIEMYVGTYTYKGILVHMCIQSPIYIDETTNFTHVYIYICHTHNMSSQMVEHPSPLPGRSWPHTSMPMLIGPYIVPADICIQRLIYPHIQMLIACIYIYEEHLQRACLSIPITLNASVVMRYQIHMMLSIGVALHLHVRYL